MRPSQNKDEEKKLSRDGHGHKIVLTNSFLDLLFHDALFQCYCDSVSTLEDELSYEMGEDEDVSEDYVTPYEILGTSPDELECQPHVLSLPMMDVLRSRLPFVIQQDNYWLKYSMIRDVS